MTDELTQSLSQVRNRYTRLRSEIKEAWDKTNVRDYFDLYNSLSATGTKLNSTLDSFQRGSREGVDVFVTETAGMLDWATTRFEQLKAEPAYERPVEDIAPPAPPRFQPEPRRDAGVSIFDGLDEEVAAARQSRPAPQPPVWEDRGSVFVEEPEAPRERPQRTMTAPPPDNSPVNRVRGGFRGTMERIDNSHNPR